MMMDLVNVRGGDKSVPAPTVTSRVAGQDPSKEHTENTMRIRPGSEMTAHSMIPH